jgi:hypothetical protein
LQNLERDLVAFSTHDVTDALLEGIEDFIIPLAEQNALANFQVRTGFYASNFQALPVAYNVVQINNPALYANRLENEVFVHAGGPHMVLYTAVREGMWDVANFISAWVSQEISQWSSMN